MPRMYQPPDYYRPSGTARIVDLMLRRGDIQAEGAARSGQIWGGAVRGLGDVASKYFTDRERERIEAPIREQEATLRGQSIELNKSRLAQGEENQKHARFQHEQAQAQVFRDEAARAVVPIFEAAHMGPDEGLKEFDSQAQRMIAKIPDIAPALDQLRQEIITDPVSGWKKLVGIFEQGSEQQAVLKKFEEENMKARTIGDDTTYVPPQKPWAKLTAPPDYLMQMSQQGQPAPQTLGGVAGGQTPPPQAFQPPPSSLPPGLPPGSFRTPPKPGKDSTIREWIAAGVVKDYAEGDRKYALQTRLPPQTNPDSIAARDLARQDREERELSARADRVYQQERTVIDRIAKPIEERSARTERLMEALNANSPAADPLIGPELLTVMAGGIGTGLRMTEAELKRIFGGRTGWEDIKSKVRKWNPNSGEAFLITGVQREQMKELVRAVSMKARARMDLIDVARDNLIDEPDPEQKRRITSKLQKDLAELEKEYEVQGSEVTVTLPDGRTKTFPNKAAADGFKKAAGIR